MVLPFCGMSTFYTVKIFLNLCINDLATSYWFVTELWIHGMYLQYTYMSVYDSCL